MLKLIFRLCRKFRGVFFVTGNLGRLLVPAREVVVVEIVVGLFGLFACVPRGFAVGYAVCFKLRVVVVLPRYFIKSDRFCKLCRVGDICPDG